MIKSRLHIVFSTLLLFIYLLNIFSYFLISGSHFIDHFIDHLHDHHHAHDFDLAGSINHEHSHEKDGHSHGFLLDEALLLAEHSEEETEDPAHITTVEKITDHVKNISNTNYKSQIPLTGYLTLDHIKNPQKNSKEPLTPPPQV